jgi:hypothetical protein
MEPFVSQHILTPRRARVFEVESACNICADGSPPKQHTQKVLALALAANSAEVIVSSSAGMFLNCQFWQKRQLKVQAP